MAIDPLKLRPTDLRRLLNSTPYGDVIDDKQLRRDRTRAGMPGRYVSFPEYVGWLVHSRHTAEEENGHTNGDASGYEKVKQRSRQRQAELALKGRDIGELPEVKDAKRKAAAETDFRRFCEGYFPKTFHLDWSDDHLKVIAKIEQAVLHGGLFAMAMPRGSGKTSLAESACIWAVLYGHRDFVCLIGSDEGHATTMLDSIKTELESNENLFEDFPEAVHPIRCIDGIANRCSGQLYNGMRTHIGWTANEVVFPTIAGSRSSAAIIKVGGITGRIRGMKYKRPDGKAVRPSLVVLDDPQTDQSSRSASQCATREAILAGAILGLAGPGRKISGIMPCTVVRPGDMADNILDRDKHPDWNGERTKMVYTFPKNEALWKRYSDLRAASLQEHGDIRSATEFYGQHRAKMDEGADVAWESRYNHDELSAIQHAMNLKLQDEAAFAAEYQNEPLPEASLGESDLTPDEVAARVNRYRRGVVPAACSHVTMFVDVQKALLYYVVCAWEEDFSGYVIDYGTWPDQRRPYFTLRDAQRTLSTTTGNTSVEGSIYEGLQALTAQALSREWPRDDGGVARIDRCLIDGNWQTDTIYKSCRQSPHGALVMPSHGTFIGASSKPMAQYKRSPGDRLGLHWRVPGAVRGRAVRHVTFDTNYWKSFVAARLLVSMGDAGSVSLWGDKSSAHRMFADHLTSEYRVRVEGRGRTVDEWKQRPDRPDNHWFDCLVGSAVAASMEGAVLFGTQEVAPIKRKRVSFADWQRGKAR